MDLYIGFDVSLASTAMCGLSEKGKLVKETSAPSEPEDLVKMLNALPGRVVAVGLEAGPLSQWLYQHLTEAGFPTVLMETRQVKGALKAMPIKTDRRDAEGIARLLQMGWFRPVHCKSLSAQEMRALLSSRKAIQQAASSLELSIRGVLRNFGLKMGQVAKGRFEQRVLELTGGNPMLEAAANPILSAPRALRQEL
ncbi:IS110 family transposase, partial [Roseinatronobacter thiooxidans]